MWTTPADAVATSYDLTPGLLSIVVCVSPYAPTYRTQVTMNELPCNPPGSRHSLASLKTALEDHVLRSAGCERGSRPAGHTPLLYFTPANSEAPGAPPFATGAFWNAVASLGARWVCSFQWPYDLFPAVAPSPTGSSAGPVRSGVSVEAWPPGPALAPGGRSTPYPPSSPQRPPALFPLDADSSVRRPGLVRVHITADTLLRIEPATRISLDFYLDSEGAILDGHGVPSTSSHSFLRSLEVAIFEELCGENGFVPSVPAPRGRFTPAITSWAFLRAATTRGASCRYRLCWPVRMEPLELFAGIPLARADRGPPSPPLPLGPTAPSGDTFSSPACQPWGVALPEWRLPQGASPHGPRA